jgi:molybdopterin molybdotransferase
MISVAEARETILSRIHTLPAERVYLEDALGRYLAEDIIANMDIPLWDNSAMDGYAVRVADVTKAPTRLLGLIPGP